MMHIVIPASSNLLMQLVNPAARSVMLAGAAGLALVIFRVKATPARLFAWKAVLCAALAMPILGWVLPSLAIPLPSVPPFTTPERATPLDRVESRNFHLTATTGTTLQHAPGGSERPPVVPHSREPQQVASPIHWTAVAIALYLVVAGLLLVRMTVGLLIGRRVLRASKAIREERLTAALSRCARSFRLASIPRCAESQMVTVPVTMGVLRPAILLPPTWSAWDEAKLDAVLAHEVSHVARRDAFTQHLSVLHRAIFWFSPLAWWLDRHLAELAEQASDEAALACGADSNDYARALLGFFETLHVTPGRVWWQGVAMAKAGRAERRVERILSWNKEGAITMGMKKSVAMVIVVLGVPFIFLAASIHATGGHAAGGALLAQQQASPIATTPAAPSAVSVPAATDRPAAPAEATSASAASASWSRGSRGSGRSGSGFFYAYGDDDDNRFVIVSGKTDTLTMSGSSQDARHVERLRKQIPGDFIWFQRDEKSYIIRDQATIDRARSFWAPQDELGKKQDALGKQQDALGKQQDAVGRRMEQVKVNVPDMSAALDKLKAELKALGATATQDQLGQIQSEIGDLQSRIGDIQSLAGDQQSKVGEEMSALGEQQSKLGEQQEQLGRQQEELARQATQKMKQLFEEAIKNGKAQPESQSGGVAI